MKKNFKWFTLIEVLLWILIFSIVILWWFQALSAVNVWKIKLIEKTNITKDIVYFSEKLFEEIKSGWTIDYEEYFNRKVVWTNTSSWHYSQNTWFWNFWDNWWVWNDSYGNWFYYCRSTTTPMWTWWCYNQPIFNNLGANWWPQRYWQYAFQFIDFNSNYSDDINSCWLWDFWDEDCDWNIKWDDDDENLWLWPVVFNNWENVKEIYLISWDGKKRTFFRWSWKVDENRPNNDDVKYPCWSISFWSGCLWTIEVLKLDWKDWWTSHSTTTPSAWTYDWIIDTWLINEKFWTWTEVIAWSNNYNYWQPLFPDTVSVSDFQVYLYPNISVKNSWKDISSSSNINPYLRLSITLEPSWKKRVSMKWEVPKYTINTTINLVDYFTK